MYWQEEEIGLFPVRGWGRNLAGGARVYGGNLSAGLPGEEFFHGHAVEES
ncbi:hypothetical protein [Anaerolinea thermolimosa]|nr:hypothetical protein [Anaerolinea thermolimosa]